MFSVVMKNNTESKKMIIEFGGKQHVVEPGVRIVVNQDDSKEGDAVKAKDLLTGKEISLKVLRKFKGDKVRGFKFKSKIRYTRRYGHRQELMTLEVTDQEAKPEAKPKTEAKKAPEKKTTTKKPAAKKVKAGTK